jgi:hypothetical protein
MSREAATAFLKALAEKPVLKALLRHHHVEQAVAAENGKQLLPTTTTGGYRLTLDDLTAAKGLAAKCTEAGELSEADLDKVAGGGGGLDGVGPGPTGPHG